ncbi:unnamed protein product [Ambrosiozyma monospora]|uniref:Unnamed protein product n=1 Tax=Ambrosiozyma monospora TaxID=43982 RepID=A0ACB5T0Q2_AMBMO|nr:unnamed protein product [Ambrosiozyma monospora]
MFEDPVEANVETTTGDLNNGQQKFPKTASVIPLPTTTVSTYSSTRTRKSSTTIRTFSIANTMRQLRDLEKLIDAFAGLSLKDYQLNDLERLIGAFARHMFWVPQFGCDQLDTFQQWITMFEDSELKLLLKPRSDQNITNRKCCS